ncbi:transposase [Serratia marcescens]|nr:transposase [Serratia marcescens]
MFDSALSVIPFRRDSLEHTTIPIDLANCAFQIHFVDADGTIRRKLLTPVQMLPFSANRPAARNVMEARFSVHHWVRQLKAFGHEVRLIAARSVHQFVKSNKNDAADAAISEASLCPCMRFLAVKSANQQAILELPRMRQQRVRVRVMQLNQLRELL